MAEEKKEIKFEQPSELLVIANRFIWLIVLIIVLLVLTAGYFLVIRPILGEIANQEISATESQDVRERNENLLRRLKELKVEYQNIRAGRQTDLARLRAVIPTDPGVAEMFVLADQLAAEHGFRLDKVDVVADKKDKKSVATSNLSPDKVIDSDQLVATSTPATTVLKSLVVHMTFTKVAPAEAGEEVLPPVGEEPEAVGPTSYQLFKEYLADLEYNLRLMDIHSVAFGELIEEEDAVFDISLLTYYQ